MVVTRRRRSRPKLMQSSSDDGDEFNSKLLKQPIVAEEVVGLIF